MKYSLSQRQIIEYFGEIDGRITVVAFNMKTQKRELTFGPSGAFRAMGFAAEYAAQGCLVHFCLDLPLNVGLIRDYAEFLVEASPYFWKPGWGWGGNF
jgi:hypothetical protein